MSIRCGRRQNAPSRNAPLGDEQPLAVQASQQLGCVPTQALPPDGGRHASALLFVAHFVAPLAFVRQQVTASGPLPHVDFAAHLTTWPWHDLGSVVSALAWCETQLTYCPWVLAVVHPAGGLIAVHAAS
jgi:hypothetical protein